MPEFVTYRSTRMRHSIHFDGGVDPVSQKPRPPIVAEFQRYQLRTNNEKLQALIESHPMFGSKVFRMEPGQAIPLGAGTQYTQGPTTTASRPVDTPPGAPAMTAGEKSALTRAKKKIEEGGELTETEQAVWDKYGKKE